MNYRETPCEKCGWRFLGFHVCVDLSAPIDPKVQKKHNNSYVNTQSVAYRQRRRDTANARWERYRQATADRDAEIVARYKEGNASIKGLAVEHKIAFQTARGILQRAQSRGELTLRPQGHNITSPGGM